MLNFIKNNKTTSLHQTLYGGILFSIIGGFLEAHTFTLRGGVFCNAQTGNIAFFIIYLVQGNIKKALYYPAPILFFIIGIFITRFLFRKFEERDSFKWHYLIIVSEIIMLAAVALIPLGEGNNIANILVSFACAIQYNSFRSADGILYSSVFCTNNLRVASENLCDYFTSKNKKKIKISIKYITLIFSFGFGVALQTFIAPYFKNYSVFICCGIFFIVLIIDFIRYKV